MIPDRSWREGARFCFVEDSLVLLVFYRDRGERNWILGNGQFGCERGLLDFGPRSTSGTGCPSPVPSPLLEKRRTTYSRTGGKGDMGGTPVDLWVMFSKPGMSQDNIIVP